MNTSPDYTRFPRVQMGRRAVGFGIDFLGVWLLSSVLGGGDRFSWAQGIVFLLAWYGTRVFVAYRNHGQTFGRWALDMKVLNVEFGKVPSLLALVIRESIVGLGAMLAAIALNNFFTSASNILLMLPLAIDCSIAFADNTRARAGHDLIARTIVASSLRGYSLDIKVKRFLAQACQRILK
ncbi:RDD domain containing protein [Gloeocapsa sp. PCC 7428]|uniref:RDD family protein n=1 Tax=Gloeocapsa sp. PCC 7428 TaxID=1173026 RepID=UPI0002A5BF77|nr:RDD family protein [Gloeocapsa sp. PCC 7428]AFZ31269.1 RDD domain containing protein [Gloeocapsa sp. PCC 7428]